MVQRPDRLLVLACQRLDRWKRPVHFSVRPQDVRQNRCIALAGLAMPVTVAGDRPRGLIAYTVILAACIAATIRFLSISMATGTDFGSPPCSASSAISSPNPGTPVSIFNRPTTAPVPFIRATSWCRSDQSIPQVICSMRRSSPRFGSVTSLRRARGADLMDRARRRGISQADHEHQRLQAHRLGSDLCGRLHLKKVDTCQRLAHDNAAQAGSVNLRGLPASRCRASTTIRGGRLSHYVKSTTHSWFGASATNLWKVHYSRRACSESCPGIPHLHKSAFREGLPALNPTELVFLARHAVGRAVACGDVQLCRWVTPDVAVRMLWPRRAEQLRGALQTQHPQPVVVHGPPSSVGRGIGKTRWEQSADAVVI